MDAGKLLFGKVESKTWQGEWLKVSARWHMKGRSHPSNEYESNIAALGEHLEKAAEISHRPAFASCPASRNSSAPSQSRWRFRRRCSGVNLSISQRVRSTSPL